MADSEYYLNPLTNRLIRKDGVAYKKIYIEMLKRQQEEEYKYIIKNDGNEIEKLKNIIRKQEKEYTDIINKKNHIIKLMNDKDI